MPDLTRDLTRLERSGSGVKRPYVSITSTDDPTYMPASTRDIGHLKELVRQVYERVGGSTASDDPALLNPARPKTSTAHPSQAVANQVPDLKARFEALVTEWKSATRFASSMIEMATHGAYQQIIGLGPAAVPLILERLARQPDFWFWALKAITGEDPVPDQARGKLQEMTSAWLAWGQEHGYEC